MPKRISNKLRDSNQIATAVVALSTSENAQMDASLLSKAMAEMGRKGGKIGGKRSLETMSKADRRNVLGRLPTPVGRQILSNLRRTFAK
jgi:hypothetical protein